MNVYSTKLINEFTNFLSKDTKYTQKKIYESSVMYLSKIRCFLEYLEQNFENFNEEEFNFRRVSEEKLLESLCYYIETRGIEFKITASNYITVLISFFDFLREKKGVTNTVLNTVDMLRQFNQQVDLVKDKYDLLDSRPKDIITEQTFELIANGCNQKLDSISIEDIKQEFEQMKQRKLYYLYVSSLATKIAQYFGAKNGIIRSLKIDQYIGNGKFEFNQYCVHIPHRMDRQIQKYLEIREFVIDFNEKNSHEYFFVNAHGNQFDNTDYETLFRILGKLISSHEVEPVAKYTVCQLIESGLKRKQIMRLTGFGLDTYLHCEEFINEKHVNSLDSKINYGDIENKKIDSVLRGTEGFVLL